MLDHKLVLNRCTNCGYWIYPHRPLCPVCLTWDPVPTEVSGRGTVFMFTLIYQDRDPNVPMSEPAVVAAVELEERPGLRYLSRIVNCPHDAIELDMPVQLTWLDEDGVPSPAFEPASQNGGAQ